MQVIGLDPRLDEGPHQRLERHGVVVDALEKDALADEHDPLLGEAPAGRPRLRTQFARVVGVNGDDDGLAVGDERPRQRRRNSLRRCDGEPRVPAQDFHVIDGGDGAASSPRPAAATGSGDRRR